MTQVENEAPYLLTRAAAARRYSMSQRQFDELYRTCPEFPTIRLGHRVLVHREQADAWFTERIGDEIELDRD